jgi:hypothetical protein
MGESSKELARQKQRFTKLWLQRNGLLIMMVWLLSSLTK